MKYIYTPMLYCLCTALCLGGCSKTNKLETDASSLTVDLRVMTDLNVTKAAAQSDENRVNTIDLFAFDAATGLLEAVRQDVPATAPADAGVAGEKKVGEITLSFGKSGPKRILAVANTGSNRVTLPATLEVGVTSYTEMLESMTQLPVDNAMPSSPFVMTGYANDVQADASTAAITLCRKVAKVTVVNETPGSESGGLVVSSLQLKNVVCRSYLFKEGTGASGSDPAFVDYPAESAQSPALNATYYVFPVPESEKMQLLLQGTLHGEAFTQTLDIRPEDQSGNPQGVKPNYQYTVKLNGENKSVAVTVTVSAVEDWSAGGDISGTITGGGSSSGTDIAFNGLRWMDRNLGASTADFKTDWNGGIGGFYQWGRNVAFPASGYATVSGPLSTLDEANGDANKDKFISGGFADWLSVSDNTLWQTPAAQPCPEGYRMPTDADLSGIFPANGTLLNMLRMTVKTGENLSGGSATGHYWGDNTNKVMYSVKRQGTDDAYYMKWECLATASGKPYLRISRWPAGASATFTDKELSAVKEEFAALSGKPEVLELPGAGYITGSSGEYGTPAGGYYWSSSLDGTGKVYRAEFTSSSVTMTAPYKSRVSGHSVRCIRL